MERRLKFALTNDTKHLGFITILFFVIFGLQRTALAEVCETPGKLNTYIFQPCTWETLMVDYSEYCRTATVNHGYTPYDKIEATNPGTTPTVTLQDFKTALQSEDYGIIYINTHGNPDGLIVETYESTDAGKIARDNAYNTYVANGYAGKIWKTADDDYYIGINGKAIEEWFIDSKTIVYMNACRSYGLNSRWKNARDVLGYDGDIWSILPNGCDTFFERLDGSRDRGEGNTRRQVDQAAQGIWNWYNLGFFHLVHTGAGNTVLSPSVIEFGPPEDEIIEEGTSGFVEFDCKMSNITASEVITRTGGADLINVRWTNDHRIDFDIINVVAFSTVNFYVHNDKAVSQNNGARLDGNTNPPGHNGVGPNKDDNFTWACNTSYIAKMDFEDGTDYYYISSTIPGLTFVPTSVYNWLYGDKRTGLYSVYPYQPPDWAIYYCNGNFFAWLGAMQGVGRINFTGATATSISMMASTYYVLNLEAYDVDDNLLDEDYVGPNSDTLRMDQLKVTANGIAYVIVRGQANNWCVDDLVVVDLLRQAIAQLPAPFDTLLEELNTINPGAVQSFLVTAQDIDDIMSFILNWGGSELKLRIYRPDGTLYGEWQTDAPPIMGDIPTPENGDWVFEVTAVDVPSDDYPFALAAVTPTHLSDVWIAPNDITCSDTDPLAGTPIEITANVHCDDGSETMPEVTVRFYDGDPGEGGVQIGDDQVVTDIAAGTSKPAHLTWTVPDGNPHNIYVVLDPDNTMEEYDEGNNQTFTTIGDAPNNLAARGGQLIAWNERLAADFGRGRGLYTYGTTDTSWDLLDTRGDITQMLEWDGKLVVDFGAGRGIWSYDGTTWNAMTYRESLNMIAWDNGTPPEKLVAEFSDSGGMWYYDTAWHWITSRGPVNQMAVWNDRLVVDFRGGGIWCYDTAWHWMTAQDTANAMVTWDDGASETLVVDLGSSRSVWRYDGAWTWMTAQDDVANMVVWDRQLVADIGYGRSMWRNDGTWHWMTASDIVNDMICWQDGTADKLVADFFGSPGATSGTWYYDAGDSQWHFMSGLENSVEMLEWNAKVVMDFGPGSGIWVYDGSWNKIHTWSTAD